MASPQEPLPASRVVRALDGMSGCIATARELAGAFLGPEAARSQVGTDVLLLVSELVTNATRHAPGPCVLELSDDGTRWTIAVTDTSQVQPQPRPPDLVEGGGGFGWHLLQTLSDTLELTATPDGGKTVIATVLQPKPPAA